MSKIYAYKWSIILIQIIISSRRQNDKLTDVYIYIYIYIYMILYGTFNIRYKVLQLKGSGGLKLFIWL